MVLRIFLFVLCPCCVILAACGGGGGAVGTPNNPVSAMGNNAALLTGQQLGANTEDNAKLSKSITVTQDSADFQVDQARVALDDTQGSYFYVTFKFTNVSTQVLCEIVFDNINYLKDGSTVNLHTTTTGAALGSYGKTGSTNYSNCLAPGQSGYFLDGIQDDGSFALKDLGIADIGDIHGQSVDKLSNTQVLPQSYSVAFVKGVLMAHVSVRNQNDYDINLYSPKCIYILLDDNNAPLIWGNFLTDPTTASITANDTLDMPGGVYYTGNSKKMVVYLNYSLANN